MAESMHSALFWIIFLQCCILSWWYLNLLDTNFQVWTSIIDQVMIQKKIWSHLNLIIWGSASFHLSISVVFALMMHAAMSKATSDVSGWTSIIVDQVWYDDSCPSDA